METRHPTDEEQSVYVFAQEIRAAAGRKYPVPAHLRDLKIASPGQYGRVAEAWEAAMSSPESPTVSIYAHFCRSCCMGIRCSPNMPAVKFCDCNESLVVVKIEPEHEMCIVPVDQTATPHNRAPSAEPPVGRTYENSTMREGSAFAETVNGVTLAAEDSTISRFTSIFGRVGISPRIAFVGTTRCPVVLASEKFEAFLLDSTPPIAPIYLDRHTGISVLDDMGSGSHGKVFEIMSTADGRIHALKVALLRRDEVNLGSELHINSNVVLFTEYVIGGKLHEYNSRLLDTQPPLAVVVPETLFVVELPRRGYALCMSMPCMECDVRSAVARSVKDVQHLPHVRMFRVNYLRGMLKTICTTLATLHDSNFVHGDIKSQNILVPGFGTPDPLRIGLSSRICDYSLSIWNGSISGNAMSSDYRAPEIWLQMNWGAPADIWGLGCVLMEIFFNGRMYSDLEPKPKAENPADYIPRIRNFFGDFPPAMTQTSVYKEILNMPFSPLRRDREIMGSQILAGPKWELGMVPGETELLDLMGEMLMIDPRKRITARDILRRPVIASVL